MRVLLVEDSERLRRYVATALKRAGHAVDTTADGNEGLWLAESNTYDAIVLDIMLPGMDGLAVLEHLRRGGGQAHVLLLTAKDMVPDRVRGLQSGADDYLVKPFALEELLARVESLCRRGYGRKHSKIVIGDLEIDTAGKTAARAGRPLDLSPREFALLEFLALRGGQVVSRAEIERHIYDDLADPMSNVVDSAICALRKKLARPNAPGLIQTRRGHGYVLEETAS